MGVFGSFRSDGETICETTGTPSFPLTEVRSIKRDHNNVMSFLLARRFQPFLHSLRIANIRRILSISDPMSSSVSPISESRFPNRLMILPNLCFLTTWCTSLFTSPDLNASVVSTPQRVRPIEVSIP